MAKTFKIDKDEFKKNTMDLLYSGVEVADKISVPEKETLVPVSELEKESSAEREEVQAPVQIKETTKQVRANSDPKKTNGTNKKDNYTITFKIDEDIQDYLKNILWINRKTKTEYVNDLIREDMMRRINLTRDASYDEIIKKWEEYKKEHNI